MQIFRRIGTRNTRANSKYILIQESLLQERGSFCLCLCGLYSLCFIQVTFHIHNDVCTQLLTMTNFWQPVKIVPGSCWNQNQLHLTHYSVNYNEFRWHFFLASHELFAICLVVCCCYCCFGIGKCVWFNAAYQFKPILFMGLVGKGACIWSRSDWGRKKREKHTWKCAVRDETMKTSK